MVPLFCLVNFGFAMIMGETFIDETDDEFLWVNVLALLSFMVCSSALDF